MIGKAAENKQAKSGQWGSKRKLFDWIKVKQSECLNWSAASLPASYPVQLIPMDDDDDKRSCI